MTIGERLDELDRTADEAQSDPLLLALAQRAIELAGPDPTLIDLAHAALRLAQRAGYQRDEAGELFQPVRYTIEHGGDCEDLAALFVALARALGLTAELIWIEQPDRPLDHVVAQVQIDGAWYWADASVCGAKVGESPYAAMDRLGAWYVVDATKPGGACAVE